MFILFHWWKRTEVVWIEIYFILITCLVDFFFCRKGDQRKLHLEGNEKNLKNLRMFNSEGTFTYLKNLKVLSFLFVSSDKKKRVGGVGTLIGVQCRTQRETRNTDSPQNLDPSSHPLPTPSPPPPLSSLFPSYSPHPSRVSLGADIDPCPTVCVRTCVFYMCHFGPLSW